MQAYRSDRGRGLAPRGARQAPWFISWTGPYPAIALIAALPRLGILLHEREEITAAFTEKSDEFAQTFVASGTYGFIPGEPSAYTQPLYGFFLVPLYEVAGRSWISI